VGVLDVCGEGLQKLAGQCSAEGSRLASSVPLGAAGPPTQVTVAAVAHAYSTIGTTAAALSGRVHATGTELMTAAMQNVKTDETSAQRLALLGGKTVQG
jgi:hypothetical protein